MNTCRRLLERSRSLCVAESAKERERGCVAERQRESSYWLSLCGEGGVCPHVGGQEGVGAAEDCPPPLIFQEEQREGGIVGTPLLTSVWRTDRDRI